MIAALLLALIASTVVACVCALHMQRLQRMLHAERASAAARVAKREAFARSEAATQERERIYNDLHDDLGAKLLGMVHTASNPAEADRARALLQDLRDVVTRSRGTAATLHETLADIRAEASQRLGAAGIALGWEIVEPLPEQAIDTPRALHLHRIIREAVSNAIRHAGTRRIRMRIKAADAMLYVAISDDGANTAAPATNAGRGVSTMRERAAELAGAIDWVPATHGGTKVLLSMPWPEPGT